MFTFIKHAIQACQAASADATAWVAALLLGIPAPVPAAVGAVITVALSLNRSLRTGLSLVGATAAAGVARLRLVVAV